MSVEEKHLSLECDICYHKGESYPLNLLGSYDAAEADLGAYYGHLRQDISRLVGDCTDVQTLTVEHPIVSRAATLKQSKPINNTSDLETYLMSIQESTSIFLSVRPLYSFGTLQISEEVLTTLLTRLSVHPGFLEILHTFGQKTEEEDEDFGVYKQYITKKAIQQPKNLVPSAFELCYNLKHVEQRKDINNQRHSTWVTRKMGIYSKYYTASDSTAWILLQPSPLVSRRLEELAASDASPRCQKRRHDFDIHILFLESAARNWTPYINHLEREFKKMDNKAFVEFEDAQRIQKLKDTLLQLSHALDINCSIISSLRQGVQVFQQERRAVYTYGTETVFHKCDLSLDSLLIQAGQHKNRVQHLIRRTDGLFALIPYMFAQRENSTMLKLSEKGAQYARSMKVITIFTMIYLPPSFVASFFGIQLFNRNSKGKLEISPEVVYYFLTTGILMLLTFGGWMLWERRLERKMRTQAHDEEKW